MTGTLLRQAASRVVAAGSSRLDPADGYRARICLAHYLACALEGGRLPWGRAVRDMVAYGSHTQKGVTLLGCRTPVGVGDAVFANATLAQCTLAEDLHRESLTHPGSVVISAALAAAEERDADGGALLSAIAAGYDVLCGLARILKTPSFAARGLRPSALFGPLGAAAAAGALKGLDHAQATSALAIAVGTGAGLREWAYAGTTDVYTQNGFAARNGALAADLAAVGITGPGSALDGPSGFSRAFLDEQVDWDEAVDWAGHTRGIHEVEFKRFPACSAVQGVLELAREIQEEHRPDPNAIEEVLVYTHRHGVTNPGCDHAGPFMSIGQAQMSNQLGVSLALHGEDMTVQSFSRHDDPSVSRLARVVRVHESEEYTSVYPDRVAAKIVLRFGSRELTRELVAATSLTDSEAEEMVSGVLSSHYGRQHATRIIEALEALEKSSSARELLDLLRKPV